MYCNRNFTLSFHWSRCATALYKNTPFKFYNSILYTGSTATRRYKRHSSTTFWGGINFLLFGLSLVFYVLIFYFLSVSVLGWRVWECMLSYSNTPEGVFNDSQWFSMMMTIRMSTMMIMLLCGRHRKRWDGRAEGLLFVICTQTRYIPVDLLPHPMLRPFIMSHFVLLFLMGLRFLMWYWIFLFLNYGLYVYEKGREQNRVVLKSKWVVESSYIQWLWWWALVVEWSVLEWREFVVMLMKINDAATLNTLSRWGDAQMLRSWLLRWYFLLSSRCSVAALMYILWGIGYRCIEIKYYFICLPF